MRTSSLSIHFADGTVTIFEYFFENGISWYTTIGSIGAVLAWKQKEAYRWSNYTSGLSAYLLKRGPQAFISMPGLFIALPRLVKSIGLSADNLAPIYRALLSIEDSGIYSFEAHFQRVSSHRILRRSSKERLGRPHWFDCVVPQVPRILLEGQIAPGNRQSSEPRGNHQGCGGERIPSLPRVLRRGPRAHDN